MADNENNKESTDALKELTKKLTAQTARKVGEVNAMSDLVELNQKLVGSILRVEQINKLSLLNSNNIIKLLSDQNEEIREYHKQEEIRALQQSRKDQPGLLSKTFASITALPKVLSASIASSLGMGGKKSGGGSKNESDGIMPKLFKGIGKGVKGLTQDIGSSAKNIAMMGVAIPAFLGGLMIGNAAIGFAETFDGFDFNFDNLKKAAAGFSKVVLELDKEALIVMGSLLGISAFTGYKAGPKVAGTIAVMGLSISAFLGGLVLGDALLGKSADVFNIDFKFDAMKKMMKGFSEMIVSLDKDALIVMGGLLGLSAFAGKTAGLKMAGSIAAMGLSISAFLGGIALGNLGLKKLGLDDAESETSKLDFSALKNTLQGFSDSIGSLSTEALTAFGGLIVIAMGGSAFKSTRPLKLMATMAAVGAGIAGFFGGFGLGEYALDKLGVIDFSGIKDATVAFDGIIGLLSENALVALGMVLGVGALMGSVGTFGSALKLATAITAVGAGIGGFFAGFATGAYAIDKLGNIDYTAIAASVTAFNDTVGILSDQALTAFGLLLAEAGIISILGGFGGALAVGVAMTGLGAGIGGFFAGFATGDYALSKINADYSSIKEAITAFGESVDALSDRALKTMGVLMAAGGILALIGGFGGGLKFAAAMTGIGLGIGGFFTGFEGVMALASGVLGLDGSAIADFMENISKGIKPFENIDMVNLSAGLIALGPALLALMGTDGLLGLGDKIKESKFNPFNWFGGDDEKEVPKEGLFGRIAKILGDPDQLDITALNDIMDGLDTRQVNTFSRNIGKITKALKEFAGDEGFFDGLMGTLTSWVTQDPLKPFLNLADKGDALFRAGLGMEKISAALQMGESDIDKKSLDKVTKFAKEIKKEQRALDAAAVSLKSIADSIVEISTVSSPSGNIVNLAQNSVSQADEMRLENERLQNTRAETGAPLVSAGNTVVADNSTSNYTNYTNVMGGGQPPAHDNTDPFLTYRTAGNSR